MRVLGLDMSSTCIGWCVIGDSAPVYGHHDLTGDIGARCALASYFVAKLLEAHETALVVIESPVARYAKAVIPQARVSGAVLAVLADESALWQEVAPAVAKRVLCGDGNASKAQMVTAAARRLGLDGDLTTIRGKVWWLDVAPLLSEDEADAYALALYGAAMRVVQVAA